MDDPRTDYQRTASRWAMLKNERSTWDAHWKDISSYLLPRAGRFFTADRNRGTKRNTKIYDNTGTRALRILGAGMMSGATSPARPWFRLGTSDPDMTDYAPVKQWLSDVTRLMLHVFSQSNTYRSLHTLYEELGAFGTGAAIVGDSFERVLHHTPLTVGEYAIALDYERQVNTLYREFDLTVAQVVEEFGLANCSQTVKNLHTSHKLDAWVTVVHAIEPRRVRDASRRDSRNMPWKSCYFESGRDDNTYLRESGMQQFRVLAPRWLLSGGDVYGSSPGMEALGDLQQLQHEQLRKAQGIDYQTRPPLQVPTSHKGREVDNLPGGVSYVDMSGPSSGIRPAWEVRLDLGHLLEDIRDVRERINAAFFADLFLMLANDHRSGITATEVAERHEEKLLMLGPVLERLHNELLDPLVDIAFDRLLTTGALPPPPPEIAGEALTVEFVSMLAQAQRAVATNGIDRFVGNLGVIAQAKPDVLDKFDADQWVDVYSDMLGVDPSLIVPDENVAIIRQQRAQAQQQAQAAEQAAMAAQTARDLSQADTGGQNALTDAAAMFSGYSTPAAGLV